MNKIFKYIKLLFYYFKIPKGDYCYDIRHIEYPTTGDGRPIIHCRYCPFYVFKENGGHLCSFTGIEDDVLLDDQVKCCSLRMREDVE